MLFEVDDQSRVWSHSQFAGFNRYDGKDAQELANDIIAFTTDENFPAAITRFGRIVRYWGVLAEVTILSLTITTNEYGYDRIEYCMIADNIFSFPSNPAYPWRAETGDEITAFAYGGAAFFEQGGRYLLLLDPSEGGPFINDSAAIINADGTITAESQQEIYNAFLEFNGYTVAQMAEEAERAKVWHERFAK